MKAWIKSAGNLFFPVVCQSCGSWLVQGENALCMHCVDELPRTGYSLQPGNPTERIFWGRIDLALAGSFLEFREGGVVQDLMHRIKYKGQKELAHALGLLYAEEIKSRFQSPPDILLPVPLHPRRERQRGYNQSEWFAKGMAEILECTVNTDLLKREIYSQSQTRKGRFTRWENVGHIFMARNKRLLEGKTAILVDDVVTTGATLEACLQCLRDIPGIRLGVLSLAIANG
ncbi:MAG: ComF family protein [Bacteroidetes bacterium]|nr:ComF family protein [Bacteroidota bacterium]